MAVELKASPKIINLAHHHSSATGYSALTPDWLAVWLLIVALTVMAVTTKAIGPALVGGRALPRWASGGIALNRCVKPVSP